MLLTVAEARKHLTDYPTGADYDDALRRLLEAAEGAITERAGPTGNRTEWHTSDKTFIFPYRSVSAVVSITETVGTTVTALAANDYRVWPGGRMIERLVTGTNARGSWTGLVTIVYASDADIAQREAVQVLLVQQFLNYHPGLNSETIGSWTQQFTANSVFNWAIERDAILSTLGDRSPVVA